MEARPAGSGAAFIERLLEATRNRDVDALTTCFAEDYRNETPAHPARGFVGRAQVRRNWEQIFAAVPDLSAEVTWVGDDQTVWSEWEMRGTRRDGQPHLIRGVVIFGLRDGHAVWARFYLEPVDHGSADVNEAVREALALPAASTPGAAS
ncbi:MAG TPA: nuclear transport factor 2 family protein [Candidatus Limnocylindrales bacterium]|nr:nuclear transport factor 2 family protein [Candidatus Limnocylindrales bacterium]